MSNAGYIVGSCKSNFTRFWADCAGFVKAVASDCGVIIVGNANDIVNNFLVPSKGGWQTLTNEHAAVAEARAGKFVVAGMAESGHGHVMVVVDERNPIHPNRAFGYWGRFHSGGEVNGREINVGRLSLGYGSITAAWRSADLPKVTFACISPSVMLLRSNSAGRSYHL